MTPKEWAQAHPEARAAIQKRYYQKNRERLKEYQHDYYLKKKALKKESTNGNLRADQSGE